MAGAFGAELRLAQPIGELTTSFVTTLLVAGSLEEFGWRGFAQLLLQQRRSALTAGVVPVVMIAHAVLNSGSVLEVGAGAPDWLPETQLGLVLWVGLVLGVIAVCGREKLAP